MQKARSVVENLLTQGKLEAAIEGSMILCKAYQELGKVGESFAFRNVKTGETLCCFVDAKSFGNRKAYVSRDGKNFYYIDKSGKKVD